MKLLDFPPPSHRVLWPWPWPRRSNCDSVDRRPFAWWRIARSTVVYLPIKNNQCILAQVSASFSKCLMFCKTCSVKKWLTTLRSVKQRPLVSSMKWGIEGRKTDLVQPKSWAVILPVHSDPDTFTRSVIMNNGQLGHVSTVTAWDHKSTSIDPSIQQSWGSTPGIQHVAVPAANVPHFHHQHDKVEWDKTAQNHQAIGPLN